MNKFLKALGISVLAVGVLGACSEQSVEKSETSDEVKQKMSDDSSSAKEKPEQKDTKAQVGETLDIDGIKITITGIEPFTGEINEYEPLKQDHAVKVGVIVENTTKESYFVDNTEFKLYDKDGFELTDALPSNEDGISSDIPAGKKVQGSLFFDVPAQSGTWEVHYESMASIDGESAIWEVPAK
ncbi:DUF4352 domain-containing protein [Priestia megaterium]|uniref:DUF4352 domain-containing protein n=1 Tax=Priestia megaterium TaxID=1404 RepID=UPI001FB4EF6F|nr:DUF4352 domain-containing protein [Priestia megaterium]